jgi:hypothetical protein
MRSFLLFTALYILSPAPATAQLFFFTTPVNGSPLLFDHWVKAKVVSRNPFFGDDSTYLFNFNSNTQKLLASADKKKEYKVSSEEFESVTFYYKTDQTLTIEHVSTINERGLFFEIIKTKDRYSLYYQLRSQVKGGTFVSFWEYYIVFPFPDSHVTKFRILNKTLIKKAFRLSPDEQKVDTWFARNTESEGLSYSLKELIGYLNQ